MEIKVILGNEQDFKIYLTKVKHHDHRSLFRYWSEVKAINRRSSNQWFLVINYGTPFTSVVSKVPISELPALEKRLPLPKYRVQGPLKGTLHVPTPLAHCYAFGEVVMNQDEIGCLHSGVMGGSHGQEEKREDATVDIQAEDHIEEERAKTRGWPKGKKRVTHGKLKGALSAAL